MDLLWSLLNIAPVDVKDEQLAESNDSRTDAECGSSGSSVSEPLPSSLDEAIHAASMVRVRSLLISICEENEAARKIASEFCLYLGMALLERRGEGSSIARTAARSTTLKQTTKGIVVTIQASLITISIDAWRKACLLWRHPQDGGTARSMRTGAIWCSIKLIIMRDGGFICGV